MKTILILLGAATLFITACSKSTNGPATPSGITITCTGTKSFATDASPLFQTFCATNSGCHGAGSVNGPGPLTSYSLIFNARSNIRSAVASGLMPQNTKLTNDQISTIVCWIDQGAANN